MHILFASYGNDSIALIQWAHRGGLSDVIVLFSETGLAADWWVERVKKAEEWVKSLGFAPERTDSIGMEELVKQRKGWPRQGMQFCTLELKIKPALGWMEKRDPERQATCLVGVRREESLARRNYPEIIEQSPNHGGRKLWAPLVTYSTQQRDELIKKAGFEVLPHRSMECFPCINSNRADLRLLAQDEARVNKIESIENQLGTTSKGKPRTMFRPYRHMGATGIREVLRWANSERGQFEAEDPDDECESGYCGM